MKSPNIFAKGVSLRVVLGIKLRSQKGKEISVKQGKIFHGKVNGESCPGLGDFGVIYKTNDLF